MCVFNNNKCTESGKVPTIFTEFGAFCEDKCHLKETREEYKKMNESISNLDWTKEPEQRDITPLLNLF